MTLQPSTSPIFKNKDKKRKRLMSLKTAMRLTNNLVKKFRDMKLFDSDELCVPLKKRKLSDIVNETSEIVRVIDCFMVDLSMYSEDRIFVNQDVSVKEISPCSKTSSKSKLSRGVGFFKKSQKLKKSAINFQNNLLPRDLQVARDCQKFFSLFQNCINFVLPAGHLAVEDIDLVVRQFSQFGKVVSIQDHWIKPRGTSNHCLSLWAGALVAYKTKEEFNRALKAFSVRQSSIICVSVVDHLNRIHCMELRWKFLLADLKDSGTRIIVEGIAPRISRMRLREEFAIYGTVLDIRWKDGRELKNSCQVTYTTTVDAVTAAIALDGKTVQRCHLRTKIIATAKELYIHRNLCERF